MDEYKDKNEGMDVWKYEWMKQNREKNKSILLFWYLTQAERKLTHVGL